MAQKCEICDRQTDFFEGVEYGDKCIFHCDKSDEAKWGNPESEDVKRFWRAIREQIQIGVDEQVKEHNFENYVFPTFEEMAIVSHYNNEDDYSTSHSKEERNFWAVDDTDRAFPIFSLPVNFRNTYFVYGAYFSYTTFSGYANFSDSLFKCDADFRHINIDEHLSFHYASAESMIFSTAKVDSNSVISFIRFSINGEFDFSSTGCRQVSFLSVDIGEKTSFVIKNTKCKGFSLSDILNKSANIRFTNIEVLQQLSMHNIMFDKTEFNGFNISNKEVKIELENTSFLGSHLTNVQWGKINEERFKIDRQMARQLKSINDAQGETVIANDFYALEMRLRSKELNWREHFGEKLVQNIHGLVSNHSNDWVLPSIWFFVFGLLFVVLAKNIIPVLLVAFVFGLIGASVFFADKIPTKHYKTVALSIFAVSILFYLESFASAEYLAAFVNPLNIKDSKDLLGDTNLVLIYACRIIEVFIGYQIITAIRKNTRRK